MTKESSAGFTGPLCRHVKLDGSGCAQPARRGKEFCRFHNTLYEPAVMPGQPLYRPPILEDSASVQIVIMQVIRELMRQPVDKSNAGLILYGLQLASNNLARFRELYPPPPPEEEEESAAHPWRRSSSTGSAKDPSHPHPNLPTSRLPSLPLSPRRMRSKRKVSRLGARLYRAPRSK